VVEPPSRRLQQILLGLKLCSPRDLRRCASRVRALSADLPAFDSVWLDALVQRRVLTSWQAQTIELDQPELLRIGPCIVEDRIGHSNRSATYLARLPGQKGQCVIKRVAVPAELRKLVSDRLKQLIERSQGATRAGILIPHSFSEVSNEPLPELEAGAKLRESASTRASRQVSTENSPRKRGSKAGVGQPRRKSHSQYSHNSGELQSELAIVSRLVDGLSLAEILLRRGRLPAADVDAMARQLLESLAALHDSGIAHGEILLNNIRLIPSGQTVLVDAGVRSAIQPEFQINAHVHPGQNDGIAPELIGTGAAATPRSDLYALGFALWHLLAGRPAFPTGDPLAKLAAHQTERIPDIREFAPDTPDRLAKMIEWLAEPVASRRPQSARELFVEGSRDRKKPVSQASGSPDHSSTGSSVPKSPKPARNSKNGSAGQGTSSPRKSAEAAPPLVSVRPAGRASRRRLSRFAASFQQPLRRTAETSSIRKTATSMACATAAMLVALAALLTLDARSRTFVLASLPQRFIESASSTFLPDSQRPANATSSGQLDDSGTSTSTISAMKPVGGNTERGLPRSAAEVRQSLKPQSQRPDSPTSNVSQLMPLPEPDPYGVVLLSEPGTYKAGSISWPGRHLTLRSLPGTPAIIMTSIFQPLNLRATEVTLENVVIRLRPDGPQTPTLTQIRSQKLTCLNCDFLTPLADMLINPDAPQRALGVSKAIQWAPIDASDPLAGELTFSDCRFVGTHSSIILAAPGRLVRCVNTLKLGGGPLFIATDGAASGDNTFEFEHSTLRDSGSLVALDLQNAPAWNFRLTIRPRSSVFDLQRRTDQESESLITFVGGRLQRVWQERVSFDGDDSVASGAVGLASWQATNGTGHQTLDASEIAVQGLIQSEFTFRNSPSLDRADSVLLDVQTNRISSQLPGISIATGNSTPENRMESLLISPETGPEL
jgi:serine/threonine protein kinase